MRSPELIEDERHERLVGMLVGAVLVNVAATIAVHADIDRHRIVWVTGVVVLMILGLLLARTWGNARVTP